MVLKLLALTGLTDTELRTAAGRLSVVAAGKGKLSLAEDGTPSS